MNIISLIEKLQEKPRYVRVRILWLSVFVCMALILLFWVIAFDYSAKEVPKGGSDFDAVSGQVGDSVREIKNQWPQVSGGIKTEINNLFENQTSTEASPFNQ
ncbi:MAG: hypothetical protein CO002_03115 [Candidatus Portnoybacteria bacterium CG_4_8_14_3_um_filter_44_10]|uniref:Uncharacterized protein n=5 Tax=Candidatus Portnoyibacteriota TaxID=1817913 RepID=A0A2H0KQ24_9BACT|nr:MAG: hypothetical protein AUK17_00825 [Parcubacteria group bacterium CG2_30_44_18]PIQ74268.1 MAG: hypothetical protein COV85_03100 [Candidatus Portnoybacteria bacterium CG11_big_fil_rev_8_21_14_0_20_44_10]PIS16592.1 MAG: hypothetical protein COT61_03075 [Candidatus Portnoybacteria bacterium CG09_land_8_20_14_0_10_44_13]PIW75243.1 MAG: hypothetical protein CO002_03115 [Candidatus Portnoybacteria bacterium CG_4_8_14_3_um_filter_44_10]PIZ71781.1 MAG: hypothetical protein COY11_00805 [Candidatus